MNPDVASILEEALRILDKHGWHQGSAQHGSRVCVGRAIFLASGNLLYRSTVSRGKCALEARRALMGHTSFRESEVEEWNDDPARTEDEIKATLKEAIRAQSEELVGA